MNESRDSIHPRQFEDPLFLNFFLAVFSFFFVLQRWTVPFSGHVPETVSSFSGGLRGCFPPRCRAVILPLLSFSCFAYLSLFASPLNTLWGSCYDLSMALTIRFFLTSLPFLVPDSYEVEVVRLASFLTV